MEVAVVSMLVMTIRIFTSTPSIKTVKAFGVKSVLWRERISIVACHEGKSSLSAEEKPEEPEWGVSYIGGDPCGSKYNDNPFDSKVDKPGMPDDMKARIAALADAKLLERNKLVDDENVEKDN